MRSRLATEVPPNFITTHDMRPAQALPATAPPSTAARNAHPFCVGLRALIKRDGSGWKHPAPGGQGNGPAPLVRVKSAAIRGKPRRNLAPPEQPLDIGELQFHVSRAAVIALARVRRRLHRPQ